MKFKKYWPVAIILLFGLLIVPKLFSNRFASENMKYLRSIEKKLNIPSVDIRKEYDLGCYKDWKNAQQYDMNIYHSYKSLYTINQARQSVEDNGWRLIDKNESNYKDLHSVSYSYENDLENDVRIFISTESGIVNTYPHSLIISYSNREDQCY